MRSAAQVQNFFEYVQQKWFQRIDALEWAISIPYVFQYETFALGRNNMAGYGIKSWEEQTNDFQGFHTNMPYSCHVLYDKIVYTRASAQLSQREGRWTFFININQGGMEA